MKKFDVLIVVKEAQRIIDFFAEYNNVILHTATGEEQAIEQLQARDVDIIIYEGSGDFGLRNKLKSLKTILRPDAEIIEYDERNISALPDDLEMAMQKVNANKTGNNKFYDDPKM